MINRLKMVNLCLIITAIVIVIIGLLLVRLWFKPRSDRIKNEIVLIKQLNKMRSVSESSRKEGIAKALNFYRNYFPYLLNKAVPRDEQELLSRHQNPGDFQKYVDEQIRGLEGITLGWQQFDRCKYQVRVPLSQFNRHFYGIGKTGYGKTTLVNNIIKQLIETGQGMAILSYEADMLKDVMSMISPDREADFILLDPMDLARPVTYNPLYLEDGEDLNLKADQVYTIFQRNFGTSDMARTDEILRNVIYTLTQLVDTTLLDVAKLLDRNKSVYRVKIVPQLDNELKDFWMNRYPGFPKNAETPILNRISRFVGFKDSPCRNVFCHKSNSLNFRQVMDQGKILLVNLSDALIGDENSKLIGQLLLNQLQLSAMSRGEVNPAKRKRFFIIIDEFQRLIQVQSIEELLSRARKMNICLMMLHQHWGQLPRQVIQSIMGNVAIQVVFNISHEDANKFSNEFTIWRDGEVAKLQPGAFLDLEIGETFARINSDTFFMKTYNFKRYWDESEIDRLKELSRQNWGVEPEHERQAEVDYSKIGRVCLNDPIFEYDPTHVFNNQ